MRHPVVPLKPAKSLRRSEIGYPIIATTLHSGNYSTPSAMAGCWEFLGHVCENLTKLPNEKQPSQQLVSFGRKFLAVYPCENRFLTRRESTKFGLCWMQRRESWQLPWKGRQLSSDNGLSKLSDLGLLANVCLTSWL